MVCLKKPQNNKKPHEAHYTETYQLNRDNGLKGAHTCPTQLTYAMQWAVCTESNENIRASDKTEAKQQNATVSKQTCTVLQLSNFVFWKGAGWGYRGVGDEPNSPFTSLLLAVSSLPAPCRPTSSRGSFLSLSPSILTRTTPDLSTISWMTFPLLPMTLPV